MIRSVIIQLTILALFLLVLVVVGTLIAWRDGPPPDLGDLRPQRVDVAPEADAYTYYDQATQALDWPKGGEQRVVAHLDGTEWDEALVTDLLQRNQRALELLAQGLVCEVCQGPPVRQPDDKLINLWASRWLSSLLALRANQSLRLGESGRAVQLCLDLARYGAHFEQIDGGMLSYLVGLAIMNTALEQSRQVAVAGHLPSAELLDFRRRLLPYDSSDEGQRRAVRGETAVCLWSVDWTRTHMHDVARALRQNDPPLKLPPRWLLPYLFQPNGTKALYVAYFRNWQENIGRTYADLALIDVTAGVCDPQTHRRPFGLPSWLRPNFVGESIYCSSVPSAERCLNSQLDCQAKFRATQLTLALAAWRQDHRSLPERLEVLVPAYIEALPLDPFDGRPLRYSAERKLVWSVGRDLKDSNGSGTPDTDSGEDLVYAL